MWEKINNQKTLQSFQEAFEFDRLEGDRADAKVLYYFLRDALRDGGVSIYSSELAEAYHILLYQAGFYTISLLRNEDVLDLFRNGLLYLFQMEDFDFLPEFKKFFTFNPEQSTIADRLVFKNQLQKILETNESKMESAKGIALGKSGLKTIGEWIKNYLSYIDQKEPDIIRLNNYLLSSPATRGMNEAERLQLTLLLKIYDHARLANFKPFLTEEDFLISDDTGTYIASEGHIERIDEKTRQETAKFRALIEEMYGAETVAKAYESSAKKIGGASNIKDIKQLMGVLRQGDFNQEKRDQVIAAIEEWAAAGTLSDIFKDAPLSRELMDEFSSAKALSPAQRAANIPESLAFLSAFLRWVFEERLGLETGKAAEEAIKIANTVKRSTGKDYLGIAYYDLGEKQFKWA